MPLGDELLSILVRPPCNQDLQDHRPTEKLRSGPWGVAATVSAMEGPARSLGILKPVPFPRLISDPEIRSSCPPAAIVAALSGPSYAAGAAPAARPRSAGAARDMAAGGERL